MGTTELELDSEAHSHKKTRRNELKVKDEVEQVQGTSSKGEPVGKLTRDAKGKGKAVEENEDVTRLRKELTLKNDVSCL